MRLPSCTRSNRHAVSAQAGRALRMMLAAVIPLSLMFEASAVFTNVGSVSLPHKISIRVGGTSGIDVVNFGTIAGNAVGNGVAVAAAAAVTIEVKATTQTVGLRTVTVNADSSAGMSCQNTSCGSTNIPFSTVAWTVSNSVAPSGSPSSFDIQAGQFSGTASQTIATFPSGRSLKNTLSFSYSNPTLFPAGTYKGRVTFTASMP